MAKRSRKEEGRIKRLHAVLDELIAMNTRGDPYTFVGRCAELGVLDAMAGGAAPAAKAGATALITGAPGAGKTALAKEAIKRMRATPGVATRVMVVPAAGDVDDIDSEYRRFVDTIAHLLCDADDPAKRRADREMAVKAGGSLGDEIGGFLETRVRNRGKHGSAFKDLAALERAVESGSLKPRPNTRAVVYVDEVQNLAKGGASARLLNDMHLQSTLPLSVICTGLSNSRRAMRDAGFSPRMDPDQDMLLGMLEPAQAPLCVSRTVDKRLAPAGLPSAPDHRERYAESLSRAANGWPSHLHHAMKCLFTALRAQENPDLRTLRMDEVMLRAKAARRKYYNERLAFAGADEEIVDALLSRLDAKPGITESNALSILEWAADAKIERDAKYARQWEQEFRSDGKTCFAELLRAGVVSFDEDGRCRAPIPSIAAHVSSLVSDPLKLGGPWAGGPAPTKARPRDSLGPTH